MPARHCVECGADGPPRTFHPSSLRIELLLWTAAVAVGLGAGFLSMVRGASSPPGEREFQAFVISSVGVGAVDEPAAPARETPGSSNVVLGIGVWMLRTALDFARSFWWVLPIPVLFSLWRQFGTYQGCVACGGRQLVPIQYD